MSPRLPVISGRQAVKAFSRIGFVVLPDRGKGSHVVMHREGWPAILTIPDHAELKKGTLRSLIRAAGITVEQFSQGL
jgi:predicted RNA binding protein YcfA (HicA-like mRNA interferase family)